MLIKIGETQWIKAKKINALKHVKEASRNSGMFTCIQTERNVSMALMILRMRPCTFSITWLQL